MDSQEREKLKEEKKKYAERLKLWNKPREDMECEDLKVSECNTEPLAGLLFMLSLSVYHVAIKFD